MSKKAIFVSDQTLSVNDSLFGLAVYIFEPLASKPVSKQPVSEKMISRDKTKNHQTPAAWLAYPPWVKWVILHQGDEILSSYTRILSKIHFKALKS